MNLFTFSSGHSLNWLLIHFDGISLFLLVSDNIPCFTLAVLGEHEVAQGIKEVHVIHEVPKEPSLNAQWRRC